MYVPEIIKVKDALEKIKKKGLIAKWELPYENLLTRRDAASFFIEPATEDPEKLEQVWKTLNRFDNFHYIVNEKQKLSKLKYEVKFDKKTAE